MTILVTRPSPSGEQLVARLRQLGRVAYHSPLIEFAPGSELTALPGMLASLVPQDLIFVLSQHAVNYADRALRQHAQHWPDFVSYYAIGRTTGLLMHRATSLPIVYPQDGETSETLLQLPALQSLKGRNALILRGNGGRELLADTLKERGVNITYCECYRRSPLHYDGSEQSSSWQRAGVNTLVVTSGEMLQQLYTLVPDYYRTTWLLSCTLIVVSERLATLARQLGWQSIRVAENADNDALIRALK
ncbi:uroporphyrinogen-III synthase [Rouxiella badensis]|jgi:uroporphyrinogen-III synthase|uniref:uroporphyrinogen-III synthase n=1 Tax=Rouxiella badensis TaxID=1646377 RepID=UPI00036ECE34|nr:uroporphyrinogen-III synthase [Rouxiella badensis]MCC3704719.1 uroporphyrinogen-III synthase [Rouxiella badensis]MCC3720894.1 uroporphyrinogen-III synthase [Rouxiella badensis]MCC3730733.1 uroporphyrinogen-III synthase [Rouxiella badensis]MCC3735157.1 uroporphyrinogen-III synthase [Rouxiella badensis]MCC3741999.1 uroporphyrinogen-III synthase [Rouxiella badensis]